MDLLWLSGSCWLECMSVELHYFHRWSSFRVTSAADFDRWEQLFDTPFTICFGLGSTERNVIFFTFLAVADTAAFRATCFAHVIECADTAVDLQQLLDQPRGHDRPNALREQGDQTE